MSYRNRAEKKKDYAKSNQAKKSNVLRDEKGTFKWEGVRGRRKKKYLTSFSDTQAKARKAMTSDKAYTWKFGDAFKNARKEGKKTFRWNNKQYHTKTKAELEKAIGAKEKERFARAGESKQAAKKKGFFAKLKSLGSPVKGREERVKAKRIAWMEKRKEAGKSYSKKNLAELKGSEKKSTDVAKAGKAYYENLKKPKYITKKPSIGLVR